MRGERAGHRSIGQGGGKPEVVHSDDGHERIEHCQHEERKEIERGVFEDVVLDRDIGS